MKKSISIISILVIVSSIIVFSCSKQSDEASSANSETKDYSFKLYDGNYEGYHSVTAERDFVIIVVRVYRISRDCLSGFGICHLEVFGQTIYPWNYDGIVKNAEAKIPITLTSEGGYFNLYLAEDVSNYTSSQLLFYVDEDITIQDPDHLLPDAYIVEAGAYEYNPNLGTYGGYTIPVK